MVIINKGTIFFNVKIKPDDGLPQIICMRCLGTLEFLCDFHHMCHSTQKDLESILGEEATKKINDKLESDSESDKENILPFKYGKRKGKSLQLEQTIISKIAETDETTVSHKTEIANEQSIEKSNNAVTVISLPISNKNIEITQEDLNMDTCKSNCQTTENEIVFDSIVNPINCQINKILFYDNSNVETTFNNCTEHSLKCDINEKKKKINKSITRKSNKFDKYFNVQSQSQLKNTNEENVISNYTNVLSKINVNEEVEQENVIFEGTVINSYGDTSIIMPLKAESYKNELKLDNALMADGSEIVQAEEIVWISNNCELSEPKNSKLINSNQSKTTSPALESEAEILQTSEENIKLTASTELIVLEVQLPAKENSIDFSKSIEVLKMNHSLSTTNKERRYSEGKFTRISELITDKQKREIETHYTIDMTVVDELKVDKNIIILDKCKFKCKICEVIYPRLDKCQVHIWRHLDMKPYICKACDFSTLTISNIRCHIRKSHLKIKPFQCHLCNKCYNSATLLEEHINIHTGFRPYKCNFCEFASTSKQVLAHHILIHKSKKDIICDICGKAFFSKGRMRAHKITHNKEQAFKCTLCSTYVLHEEALERHYMNVHMQDYICKICNKVYKSRKALHNHESVHSDAKFECPMCPNVYKSTHILKEHILKHQGIRQYKCNSCNKSFAQQSHLAAHMAVHSNITYNCPGCQKGFNRHDNMKVHTKRCEQFLANPLLQNLLTKRKISFSKNHTAKVISQKNDKNFNEKKKNRKKLKNRFKITVSEKSLIEDVEPNDNTTITVNNELK